LYFKIILYNFRASNITKLEDRLSEIQLIPSDNVDENDEKTNESKLRKKKEELARKDKETEER